MADVVAIVKIYPSEDVSDMESLILRISESLPTTYRIIANETIEIAYGYKALLLHIRFPENTEGGTEELESKILSVTGVSSVEIEAVSRIL
ncbi:MAG TPA: elongation factor 1-beta [Sulfolobales archaeon]|nr:elongation factor 1-beta [Sulfolobales archaeon]